MGKEKEKDVAGVWKGNKGKMTLGNSMFMSSFEGSQQLPVMSLPLHNTRTALSHGSCVCAHPSDGHTAPHAESSPSLKLTLALLPRSGTVFRTLPKIFQVSTSP